MSELNAAWGLALLKDYKKIISRKSVYEEYIRKLNLNKIEIIKPSENNNYNYFPVIFSSEKKKIKIISKLNSSRIYPRKYFYPSLNKLSHFKKKICLFQKIYQKEFFAFQYMKI